MDYILRTTVVHVCVYLFDSFETMLLGKHSHIGSSPRFDLEEAFREMDSNQ